MSQLPDAVGRARRIVEPILRDAVSTLTPEMRAPAEYHFGWTERDGSAVSGGGGKGIRPTLAVLSAEAAGASGEVAGPGAAAVELVHAFSLLHDDIIDNDTERRHRPTVWSSWSLGDGVIVGDALHALAFDLLLSDPTAERVEATRRLAVGTAAMIAGQSADMSFDERNDVSFADCLNMEAGKTGALLAYSSSVGAVLAGADADVVDALHDFGAAVGLAFQAVDDVLGIWGDPSVTGKAAGNDLRERKRSMPVTAALHSGAPEVAEIAEMYARDELHADEIAHLAGLIESAGGRSATDEEAQRQYDLAVESLSHPGLEPSAVAELTDVAQFIVRRSY